MLVDCCRTALGDIAVYVLFIDNFVIDKHLCLSSKYHAILNELIKQS